ncbi:hypothetical protein C3B55_00354 [Candidatus Pseudomonas adelgestsugas]|uniref:Uncharacterized protein n=1 Tax=Candidatus Pseudomonas adelgestsugas TaxID=1302376 RepID=A0ABX5R8P5_9PSED|nr:hypothetical protein C3B55_00354 [Candidatus Pseudomonas adelgestsugas]
MLNLEIKQITYAYTATIGLRSPEAPLQLNNRSHWRGGHVLLQSPLCNCIGR